MSDTNLGPAPETVAVPTNTEGQADHKDGTYTPVFSDTVRTVIYVVTLVAGVVGLGVSAFGDPQVGAYISSAAGIIAAGFGTTYSPVRMNKLR